MINVLITGTNSYIGTSVEKYLTNYNKAIIVRSIDMKDSNWRSQSFIGVDTIFHVAGIAHSDTKKVSDSQKDLYYKVNTELAIETAVKAKKEGTKQFIYMSSSIVYGESTSFTKECIITKDTKENPSNFYGDSKLRAEQGLLALCDSSFHVVILRPPMIYGKGSKGNYPTLSKIAQKTPIFPMVKNKRSALYIENLAEFVRLMIVNKETGVFFPQNSEYFCTSELVRLIAETHGKKILILRGFSLMIYLLGVISKKVNKAFGNMCYEQNMSTYKTNYCLFTFEESIRRTEKENEENNMDN